MNSHLSTVRFESNNFRSSIPINSNLQTMLLETIKKNVGCIVFLSHLFERNCNSNIINHTRLPLICTLLSSDGHPLTFRLITVEIIYSNKQ